MKTKGAPRTNGATCGAKTKANGEPCRQPAGFRTDHLGEGRCRFHGGVFKLKHGKYTKLKDPRNILRCLDVGHKRFISEVWDVTKEGRALESSDINTHRNRATMMTFAIEYGLTTDIDENGEPFELTVEEVSEKIASNPGLFELLRKWTAIGSRIEERAARIRAMDATFTSNEVLELAKQFTRIIMKYIPDPKQREAVVNELQGIKTDLERISHQRENLISSTS